MGVHKTIATLRADGSPRISGIELQLKDGDVTLAGLLEQLPPPGEDAEPDAGHFRLDIRELSLTYVGTSADHLVIESWHADRGWQRRTH